MSKRIRNVLKRILVFSLVAVLLVGCGTTSTDEPVDSSVEVTDDANDTVVEDTTTEDVVEDDATTEEEVVEDDATTEEEVVEEDTTTEEEVVEEDNLDTALFVYDGVNNKQIDIPVVDLLPDYVAGDTIRVTAVMSGDGGYTGGLGICKGDNYEWNQVDYAHFDGGQHTWEMVVTPTSPDIAVMVWTVEGTYVILKDIKVVKADPSEIVEEAPVEIDLDYTFDGAANRQIDIPVTSVLPDFQYGDAIKVKAVLSGDGGYAGGLGICVGSNYEWNQVQYDCWDGGTNTWEMVVVPSSPDVAVMVWTVQGTYVHLDSFSISYANEEEAAQAEEKAAISSVEYSKNPLTGEIFWTELGGEHIKLWKRTDMVEGLDPDPRQFTIDLNKIPEFQVGATIRITTFIDHNANFVVDLVTSVEGNGWLPCRIQKPGCGGVTTVWDVTPNVDWVKVCCWWMEGSEVALDDYKIEVISGGKTAPTIDLDDVLGNLADAEEFVETPVTVNPNDVAVTVAAEDLGLANMRDNDAIVVAFESDAEPALLLVRPTLSPTVIRPSYVQDAVATYDANGAEVKYAVFTGWDMKLAASYDLGLVTEVKVVAGAAETTVNSLVVSGETIEVTNTFSGTETFNGTGSFTIDVVEGLGAVEVGEVIKVDLSATIDAGSFNADVIVANNLVNGAPTYFVNRFADEVRTDSYYYVVGNASDFTVKVQMDYMDGGTECIYNYTVSRTDLTTADVATATATMTGLGAQTITLPALAEGKAYEVYAVLKGNADLLFAGTVGGATFDASGWAYANGIVKTTVTSNEVVVDITTYTSASGKTIPVYLTAKVVDAPTAPQAIAVLNSANKEAQLGDYFWGAGHQNGANVILKVTLKSEAGKGFKGKLFGGLTDGSMFYSPVYMHNSGENEYNGSEVVWVYGVDGFKDWFNIQLDECAADVYITNVEVIAKPDGTARPIGVLDARTTTKFLDVTRMFQEAGYSTTDPVTISVVYKAESPTPIEGQLYVQNGPKYFKSDGTSATYTVTETYPNGIGEHGVQAQLFWCNTAVTIESVTFTTPGSGSPSATAYALLQRVIGE